LARTLAVRPRPKVERLPELIRPEREIRAPAFCDEGSGPLRAGGTDTARPDAKIVVAAHGRAPTHRAKGMKSRRNQH
jgi:hypothetical protein